MQCAVESPAILYALVGIANAIVVAKLGDRSRDGRITSCRYRALHHIRRTLGSSVRVDHYVVYAIALLLRLEVGDGSDVNVKA